MKYRVRPDFYVHFSENQVYEPGTILDLDESEYALYAHQLERVEEPSTKTKKEPVDE